LSPTSGKAALVSLYAAISYGGEFLGVPESLALSALMDKYHIVLLQALSCGEIIWCLFCASRYH
jgi:hypothetical protein